MSGKIVNLFISPDTKSSMQEVNQIILEENKGIFGEGKSETNSDVTLIEIEKINEFNSNFNQDITPEEFGRNIIISNCDLNSLVDKEFKIGNVVLKGISLCEPSISLAQKLDNEKVLTEMIHKSGLRAQIIKGGSIEMSSQLEI